MDDCLKFLYGEKVEVEAGERIVWGELLGSPQFVYGIGKD